MSLLNAEKRNELRTHWGNSTEEVLDSISEAMTDAALAMKAHTNGTPAWAACFQVWATLNHTAQALRIATLQSVDAQAIEARLAELAADDAAAIA